MAEWMPERLSVVVPTYNRPDLLARVLAGLEAQTWPRDRFEVIVVDDGGAQPAAPVVAAAAARGLPVVCERQENAGPAAARNRGTRRAAGDVVVYLDDDCVPEARLLEEHARGHTRRGLATNGRIAWHPEVPQTALIRCVTERFLFNFDLIGAAEDAPFNTFYTANAAVDRAAALAAGLFDEEFPRAAWEDTEFAYRLRQAGVRFVYRAGALVYHLRDFDLAGFLRRQRAAGYEAVRVCRKHPELRHLTGLDQIVGEAIEFDFYTSAGRYALLIGMGEALAPDGPGTRALAGAAEALSGAPDLERWRDEYVREHERQARQWLQARQQTIDALHREVDRLQADLRAAEQWVADLKAHLQEQQQAFADQARWAAELEAQLLRQAHGGMLGRLRRLVGALVTRRDG
jgi:cellulose synthase/poly-beta-1,6-N-acetylglucosamine synthase-like glycosyltransferase